MENSNKYFKFVMSSTYEPFVAELEPIDGYTIFHHDGQIVDGQAWKLIYIWKYDGTNLISTNEDHCYSIILSPDDKRVEFKLNEITIAKSQKNGEGIYAFSSINSPYFNSYQNYFESYCPILKNMCC